MTQPKAGPKPLALLLTREYLSITLALTSNQVNRYVRREGWVELPPHLQ